MDKTQTIKIWMTTHRKLKLATALAGETILAFLERVISTELARLEQERHRAASAHDTPEPDA